MQYKSQHEYYFNNDFDGPFWDFLNDQESKKILSSLAEIWLMPTIPVTAFDNMDHNQFVAQVMLSIMQGSPILEKDNKIFISGIYIIISCFIELLSSKLQGYSLDEDVLIRLLGGGIKNEYYTTGEAGDYLWDKLNKEAKLMEKGMNMKDAKISSLMNSLLCLHTEFAFKKTNEQLLKLNNFSIKLASNKKELKLDTEPLEATFDLSVLNSRVMKFTKEGLAIVKAIFNNEPIIVKGFKQMRIKRSSIFSPDKLLASILACLYFEQELFFYYDSYSFDMGVCDRKSLVLNYDHPTIVLSFNSFLEDLFPAHKYKFNSRKEHLVDANNKQDALKMMFDDAYELMSKVGPDHLSLLIKGVVDNNNEYSNIKEKLPFGIVGFNQVNESKRGVGFVLEKELKGYKKRIKK